MKYVLFILLGVFILVGQPSLKTLQAPREINYETLDGGKIFATLRSNGEQAVVLAHGAVFNKESWDPLANTLVQEGYTVLALDFRGYGKSVSGSRERALYEDILGATKYLQQSGYKHISIVGGSMGGGAAALAAVEIGDGEIRSLILLSPVPIPNPEMIKAGKIIYIASEGEGLIGRVRAQYERAPEPKILEVLPGDAHAQHIFKTDQGVRLTQLIVQYLAENSQ